MSFIKAPRGVHDVLPEESWKWNYVFEVTNQTANLFNYKEVHLPIFEHTQLFSRGIGETTDIVEKEMYTFKDKSGRSLTLRPEATASMVRCYLEHGMKNRQQPVKLWCKGSMFRHERPQKGRYRQFWQIDFEALGSQDPLLDVEVVYLSVFLFEKLGLKNLRVALNSVGCPKCRPAYKEALQNFLKPHYEKLCKVCQSRFHRNVLRILDCKNQTCREITQDAPPIFEYLCEECKTHFEKLKEGLQKLNLLVEIDKRLVRGLDYYTKTAYEILSGELGAQNAVCGGGRYDHLAEAIGGPFVPGVGFAAGVERIVLVMEQQGCSFGTPPQIDVFVAVAEQENRLIALKLVSELRKNDIKADMDFTGKSLKSQMKQANSLNAPFVCIIGGKELKNNKILLRNMITKQQKEIDLNSLILHLKKLLKGEEVKI